MPTKTELLTPEQLHMMRLEQLCRVFTLTDSTLAGRHISCGVMGAGTAQQVSGAPAASNGRQVFFNADKIKDIRTADGLVVINGLNYHELSHILFTPSQGSALFLSVIKEKLNHAFNVLEDQRIETLLTTMYPSVAPYFVATVAEYFVNVDADRHENVWPYLYGRKYLPADMRAYFRKLYGKSAPEKLKRVEDIVREYVATNVHAQSNKTRCVALIREFDRLTGGMNEFMPFGHDEKQAKAAEGADDGTETRKVLRQLGKADPAKDAEDAEDGGADGDGQSDEEGDEEGAGKGSDGDDEASGGGGDTEGDDDGEGDGEGESDADVDTEPTAGTGDRSDWKDPKAQLTKIADVAKTDEKITTDIRHQREAMGDGKRFIPGLDHIGGVKMAQPSHAAVIASKKFAVEIQRLVADIDPGWHTHQASGRVNVGRLMNGGDRDSVFDTWDAGKMDADSVEVVVLLDISGSMSRRMFQASEAMWAIKTGVELGSGNSRCSVLVFSTSGKYLYGPDEKAAKGVMKSIAADGGTDPGEATFEALRILANSKKRKKVALYITDGAWSDLYGDPMTHDNIRKMGLGSGAKPAMGAEKSIEKMNEAGIVTACVFIGGYHGMVTQDHGCSISGQVGAPGDLVGIAKKIVKACIKS